MEIKKVGVIGAGTMGAGIAAQVANAGFPVVLLDIVPKEGDRNAIAAGAVKKMHKTKPAPYMSKRAAKLISVGNIEDNMDMLSDCDWIVEVVIERLDIKQNLYREIDKVRKKDAFVSSNTSTIPLHDLVEGMPTNFTEDFLITHFFNPPRYMRLLELTGGKDTRPEALKTVGDFCDKRLGKGVVHCKDTPGFIGNRIGVYWIQVGILEAIKMGLSVEEADAIMGRPIGVPKTGVFGLSDLVGIDLMPHLMASMTRTLPKDDVFHTKAEIPEMVNQMIEEGYIGRKGKGGFFRMNKDSGKRVKEAKNLTTGDYQPAAKPALKSIKSKGLRALVTHEDKGGKYARSVLFQILHYTASLVPEIADNVVAVDEAIKLGYGWAKGPFEMIDELGTEWLANEFVADGFSVPSLLETAKGKTFYRIENGELQYLNTSGDYQNVERPEGVLLLSDIKRKSKPLAKNPSASLWNIGDGVVCLEYHSKMNAFDPMIMEMMHTAVALVDQHDDYKALVLHNEAPNYSVGANLGLIIYGANMASWDQLSDLIKGGQDTFMAMKYSNFPVVGAPSGMCLGGGCESLLHCDAVQAHAETYRGLVEVGVGVVPGWGGCKELLMRWWKNKRRPGGPMPPISKAFEFISTAKASSSAAEAQEMLFLRHDDGISMNKDRLLADAKARALSMVDGYEVPEEPLLRLPGPTAKSALKLAVDGFQLQGMASEYDAEIAMHLGDVLSGGDTDVTEEVSEQDLLDLERAAFVALVKKPKTLDRIEHMLTTGKPLRN